MGFDLSSLAPAPAVGAGRVLALPGGYDGRRQVNSCPAAPLYPRQEESSAPDLTGRLIGCSPAWMLWTLNHRLPFSKRGCIQCRPLSQFDYSGWKQ